MTSWNISRVQKKRYMPPLPTFHILIATKGRPCLQRMLDSLKNELLSNDAITIVFDGKGSITSSGFSDVWLHGHLSHITIIEEEQPLGYWGHGIRNKYQGRLSPKTSFVMNADDDDVYVSGSFAILRNSCMLNSSILYIACLFDSKKNIRIPSLVEYKIIQNDISTQCGIIPFDNASSAQWGLRYGGDFDYYDQLQHHVSSVVYLHTIIYTTQPVHA